MKSHSVVHCFCLAFVPILIITTVWCGRSHELKEGLDKNGANINGVLRVLPNNHLGEGAFGLVYKGIRIKDSKPVAVKFIVGDEVAQNEYSMYSYLHAIDNATVERYGIPAVYYYAKLMNYTVMAITLCENSLSDRKADFVDPLNALIIFEQFVRQLKYLHSCGIRHDDLKPDNIMIRLYQSFLIDYNLGSKMNDDMQLCRYRYRPRRMHFSDQNRKAIDDFESFFYVMAEICDVPLKWFSDEYKNLSTEEELDRKIGNAKRDFADIRNQIESIRSPLLRTVFMTSFDEILRKHDTGFPDYDRLHKYIADRIKEVSKPPFFTWMDRQDINRAVEHIKLNPIPNIADITDPRQVRYIYPRVNENYFNGTSTAGPSKHH